MRRQVGGHCIRADSDCARELRQARISGGVQMEKDSEKLTFSHMPLRLLPLPLVLSPPPPDIVDLIRTTEQIQLGQGHSRVVAVAGPQPVGFGIPAAPDD